MQIINSKEYHTTGKYETSLIYVGQSNGRPVFEDERSQIDLRWNLDIQAWTVTGGQITFVSYSNVTDPIDAVGWTYHPDGNGPNAAVYQAPCVTIIAISIAAISTTTPSANGTLTFNISVLQSK